MLLMGIGLFKLLGNWFPFVLQRAHFGHRTLSRRGLSATVGQ